MKYYIALLLVVCGLCLCGCTEDEKADAREFWLGVPNKTPPPTPSFLNVSPTDSPNVRSYKEQAIQARADEYQKLSSRAAMRRFAEKADTLDVHNLTDISNNRARPMVLDDNFRENLALKLPAQKHIPSPTEYQEGQWGNTARMGGALQDFSAEMMRHDAIKQERKAIDEARNALYSYSLRMEEIKRSIIGR